MFKNVNTVNLEDVNTKVLQPAGRPLVQSCERFKELYAEGRRLIKSKRQVNGVKVDLRDTPFPLERLQGVGEGDGEGEEGGDLRVEVEVQEELGGRRRSREEQGEAARQIAALTAQLEAYRLQLATMQQQHQAQLLERAPPVVVAPRHPGGRGRLPWDQLGSEGKRRELLPITEQLERIAERRGVEVESLAANLIFRNTYVKDRKMAEVAGRIERGEDMELGVMNMTTMSWLATKGDGMGKSLLSQTKTVFAAQGVARMPSWKEMMVEWNKMVPTPHYVQDNAGATNGVFYNMAEFLHCHMLRQLEAWERKGMLPPPGHYHLNIKVSLVLVFFSLLQFYSSLSSHIMS